MTGTINPDDVLALLEDGAHSTSELAAWLDTTVGAMSHVLTALAREGKVSRSHGGAQGQSGRWRLVVAAIVAPAPPPIRPDAIVDQVQFGPKFSSALALALHVTPAALQPVLEQLQRDGRVKPVGRGQQQRWALASWTPDLGMRPSTKTAPPSATQRLQQGSSSGALPANDFTAFSQPKRVDPHPSWWTQYADPGLPRHAFTHAAEARNAEMLAKSPAWRRPTVPFTGDKPPVMLKEIL